MARRAKAGLPAALALLAGMLLWEIVGDFGSVPWLPPISAVLGRIADLWVSGRLQPALVASLTDLLVGYVIAVCLGVSLGILMGLSEKAAWALRPYVDAGLFVPPIVLAPIFLVVLGLSEVTLIAIVVVFATFVVATTTQTAVSTSDWHLRTMAISLGANRFQVLTEVTLREAAPLLFAGLHLGMARAVKGMVIGELFIALAGLGKLEEVYQNNFDGTGIWAITVVIVAVALVASGAIGAVDRTANGWTR